MNAKQNKVNGSLLFLNDEHPFVDKLAMLIIIAIKVSQNSSHVHVNYQI